MSNQADYRMILEDALEQLRERAEQIQPRTAYEEGKLMAYYEILSGLVNQARLLGLEPDDIGFQGFRPELLLKKRQAA
jgi:hypothetical protein